MSRNSQQKRAARGKARARQRARQGAERRAGGGWEFPNGSGAPFDAYFQRPESQPAGPTVDDVLGWAYEGMGFMVWIPHAMAADVEALARRAEVSLTQWLKVAYGAGWQPTELIREAGRSAKGNAAEMLRGVIAAERAARQDLTASDESWRRQWSAVGALDWAPQRGWLVDRAVSDDGWLKDFYRLAWMLGRLPVLAPVLPAPAGVKHRKAGPLHTAPAASNPVLDRVRALLAKAESTEHESEAMLLTAKAQELMTKHALEEAMLVGSPTGDGGPGMIRLAVDAPYADIKAYLLQTIAEQSRCRTLLLSSLGLSTVIGYPSDLQAVEMLFTSLLLQAQHALAEAGAAAPPGSRVRSQAFRASFLTGFAGRISSRLAEANTRTFEESKEDADRFLPVLKAREERIGEFVTERFGGTIGKNVRGGSDPLGYHHGIAAADQVTLVAGALEDA